MPSDWIEFFTSTTKVVDTNRVVTGPRIRAFAPNAGAVSFFCPRHVTGADELRVLIEFLLSSHVLHHPAEPNDFEHNVLWAAMYQHEQKHARSLDQVRPVPSHHLAPRSLCCTGKELVSNAGIRSQLKRQLAILVARSSGFIQMDVNSCTAAALLARAATCMQQRAVIIWMSRGQHLQPHPSPQ